MTYKTTDIVAALRELFAEHPDDVDAALDALAARFPGISHAEIERALVVRKDDLRQAKEDSDADYRRASKQAEEALHLAEGLPPDTLLVEAIAIKAAQGDAVAARYLAKLNSPAYRVHEALEQAAMRADPKNWREGKAGHWRWLGQGDMPVPRLATKADFDRMVDLARDTLR